VAWQLVAEMLDLPVKLTPAERLLLVALAERADPQTRECWPGQDELCGRTGLSPRGLGDTFARLASRGLEVRVPLKPGASGRGAFARIGVQRRYRLPPKVVTPERDHSAGRGHATAPERSRLSAKVVTPERDPNRHRTLNEPSTPVRTRSASAPDANGQTDICAGCGQLFTQLPGLPPRLYCTTGCSETARKQRAQALKARRAAWRGTCPSCGQQIWVTQRSRICVHYIGEDIYNRCPASGEWIST